MRYGKSRKSKTSSHGKVDTLIGEHTEITGDIRFVGGLHIEGMVKGDVRAHVASEDALAVISERGRVEGELRVPNLVVNGEVTGDVYATEHLDLAKNARVQGDVYYKNMEMASGGEINGKLVRIDQEPQQYLEHQGVEPRVDVGEAVAGPESHVQADAAEPTVPGGESLRSDDREDSREKT